MMKIRFGKVLPALVVVAAVLVLGACASAPTSNPTPASTTTPTTTPAYTVKTASKAGIGDYLVDSKGMTLYYFTKDSVGKSTATAAIIANWPIFNPAVFVVPSSLKAADFGIITREDGQKQATYKGWPLYYYAKDQAPGDTSGQGVNSIWFVISPDKFPPQPTTTPTATSTPTPTTTPTTSPSPGPSVTVDLIAQGFAFDKSTITVQAGASVTINFNNKDSGIPHNFSVYTSSSATNSIYIGQPTITGPATTIYKFTAPSTPGTYFFRCDVHPTTMTGSFIVTAAGTPTSTATATPTPSGGGGDGY